MSAFYTNYVSFCGKIKKSPSAVAEEIGLSRTSPNGWKKGKCPSDVTLAKLSQYFGVPISDLTGEQKEKPSAAIGEELQIPGYDALSNENKVKAREYISMLLKLQDK